MFLKTSGSAVLVLISLIFGGQMALALDLQGHRGARGKMPENTLPAFAYALSVGVTTLELDVGVTSDGIVIVSHDPIPSSAVVRDDMGKWIAKGGPSFRQMTLENVKKFDVGSIDPSSRYAGRFADQKQMDGVTIPTLAEVFDLVKRSGNETVLFNIETKLHPGKPELTLAPAEFTEKVLAVFKASDMLPRVTLQSFDWRTLAEAKRQAPEISTAYLSAQQKWLDNIQIGQDGTSAWTNGMDADDFASVPDMIAKAGGQVWSPFHRDVDPASLSRAHELGLLVNVWTVNDGPRMAELIDMGVDGIITDDPALLRKTMANRGMDLPKATPVQP